MNSQILTLVPSSYQSYQYSGEERREVSKEKRRNYIRYAIISKRCITVIQNEDILTDEEQDIINEINALEARTKQLRINFLCQFYENCKKLDIKLEKKVKPKNLFEQIQEVQPPISGCYILTT